MVRRLPGTGRFSTLLILLAATATLRCTGPNTPTPPPPPPPDPAAVEITCPQPVTVASLRGEPTVVVYGQATAISGAPPVTVSCTPQSGGAFPVGTSTVTCLATDARQRTAPCTFTITVTSPPRISLTRVVAFGDSMTSGEIPGLGPNPFTGGFFVDPGSAYPRRLEVALVGRYTAQTPFVRNQGLSGEQAIQGRSRLSGVLAGAGYEVLLLMEGANDLLLGEARAVDPAVSAMQFMVRDAKSRGLRVFLATLPPQNPLACCPRRGSAAAFVEPYNNRLRSLAAAEGVTLVDVYPAFNGDTTTLIDFDGLHPTAAGYQRIADTFFKSITQTLELSPTLTWDPRAMVTGGFLIRRR
jgi:lysophospholipase L1-like esterase